MIAKLSEWKVELSQPTITAGAVTFTVTNTGSVPHAFEVEGQGIEQETEVIQPGSSATLKLTLKPGNYDVYCPVGGDSHKHLGMETHLRVVSAKGASASAPGRSKRASESATRWRRASRHPRSRSIRVTGAGPVIQILPGPFPFPDSAAPILKQFGDEREGLESQVKDGPYSNNVSPISGTFSFTAWDKGAVRDSVDGIAEFTTQDGARWKLALDRVQTKDVPHHPRFGGVIMGLYYHGNTAVHTPLVPTINSAVALWAVGHLYKNDALVDRQRDGARDVAVAHPPRRAISRSSAGTAPRTRSKSCSSRSSPDRASRSWTRPAGSCSSTGRSPAPPSRRAEEDDAMNLRTAIIGCLALASLAGCSGYYVDGPLRKWWPNRGRRRRRRRPGWSGHRRARAFSS